MNTAIAATTRSVPTASITLAAANDLIAAAHAAAKRTGFEAAVAVTDPGGYLVAFVRTEGVAFLTADVGIDKAWTAASFGLGTHVWNQIVNTNPQAAQLAHRPRLVAVGSGYPVREGGRLVGAIGISGGSAAQDHDACEAALRAVGFDTAE